MSGHTTPWTHHHQGEPVVRNLGQVFRQPPLPPTPPTWTAPTTMRSPLGHPQAGTVHVGPHAHHDIRPGHPHAAPNLFGRVPRPEGNLAQAYQTAFECQVEWNGKVSERYAHPRIWGSQLMRVTVDRTQATVPVRHC